MLTAKISRCLQWGFFFSNRIELIFRWGFSAVELEANRSVTSAKQYCERKPNWEQLDHSGNTEDPSLIVGVAARTRTALRSAGRRDGTAWLLSLASFISIVYLSSFVASSFSASRDLFAHSRVHGKTTTIEHSQQDQPTASDAVFSFVPTSLTSSDCDGLGNRSLHPSSGDTQLADKLLIGLSALPDRHANYFVQQHTAEHRWSAATLLVPSSQVKPPTVCLSTQKSIKKEKSRCVLCVLAAMSGLNFFNFGRFICQPCFTWRSLCESLFGVMLNAKCHSRNGYIAKNNLHFWGQAG